MKKIITFVALILLLSSAIFIEKVCYQNEDGFSLFYTLEGEKITGTFEHNGETHNFMGKLLVNENKLHLIYEDGSQEFWNITAEGLENSDIGIRLTKTACP